MKRFFIFAVLIFVSAILVNAQSRSQEKQIERIAAKIADTDDLGRLDQRLIRGSLKIVIEYDAGEPLPDVRRFRSFKAAERWLKSRERDGFPIRMFCELEGCREGRCYFDIVGGMSHNRLYTKKILYGYRKKRPYIKAIYFLAG